MKRDTDLHAGERHAVLWKDWTVATQGGEP
jgi:hypothetical protein